jgi:biofilm PGA synthesis N-glycosyltransferase PgaC
MYLDRNYDQKVFRHYFWMIWYPLFYWMLNMCTTIWSVPKVLLRKNGRRAVWVSPDRGVGSVDAPGATSPKSEIIVLHPESSSREPRHD